VDGRAYSDPDFALDDTADEDDIRVRDACRPRVKVWYEYDFGTSWQHEITAQQAFTLDPGQECPVCMAYQGDSPVEYFSEEDPQEPAPSASPTSTACSPHSSDEPGTSAADAPAQTTKYS
jgi:Plasmid pRiA4b ORF-3-like protein